MKYIVGTSSIGDEDFIVVSLVDEEKEDKDDDNCGVYSESSGKEVSEKLKREGHEVVEVF